MLDIQVKALHRVIACNGSMAMGGNTPPVDQPQSDDAIEGIAAHFVAFTVLSGQHADPLEWVERRTPSGFVVTPDMAEFIDDFTGEVLARSKFAPPERFVDYQIDFSLTPEIAIRGRVDCAAYHKDTKTLHIDDLRYGWRIVEPFENWELIAKAIGFLAEKNFEPDRIVFTIFQPRPFHPEGPVRTWEIDVPTLLTYQIRMSAALANLSNDLLTGPHCANCSAIANCTAARLAALNAIEAIGEAFNDDIPDAALAYELSNLERAADAIELRRNALKELGTHRIKSGRTVEGWTVEAAYGHRKWNDGLTADALAAMTGNKVNFNQTPKLISPAQAQKAGVDETVVNSLAKRPFIGERLVRFNASKKGAKLFNTKGN
jgi:hypothetical protein